MSRLSLILTSARHYWRGHLGLLFGAFLASAILSGSLFVGDSVRASLRRVASFRLGQIQAGVLGGDRWFTEKLARKSKSVPFILAVGSASAGNGNVRVNNAQILGVDDSFWSLSPSGKKITLGSNEIAINEPLARKLNAKTGDSILLRLERPSAISRDAPLSGSTNEQVTLRRTIAAIVPPEDFGAFQLIASQITPDTAFVALGDLQKQIEMEGRVNASLGMLDPSKRTLEDFGLKLTRVSGAQKEWEISTSRVFLDPILAEKLLATPQAYGVLTYLVNGITSAKGGTPYSMITAADRMNSSLTDHASRITITITQWLADDHNLQIGDDLTLKYFTVGLGRELKQEDATFKVSKILSMTDPEVTKAWTPEFPGVSDVDNCRDWEPGIPMDMKAIRDKDEKYWDDHKGTPKGFISLAAGQKLWNNRFGAHTAIRFPDSGQDEAALKQEIVSKLQLSDIGLVARDFKADADAAAKGSVDFGGLFIGLSLFLIAAALVFAALLFLFTLERRASQIGLLLAIGWTPNNVRRVLLLEAGVIAIVGVLLGIFGGRFYTQLALDGLSGAWNGAAKGLPLIFEASPTTQVAASLGTLLVVLLTLGWASRKLFASPARNLIDGGEQTISENNRAKKPLLPHWLPFALMPVLPVLPMFASVKDPMMLSGMFFAFGTAYLVVGLLVLRDRLRSGGRGTAMSIMQIGLRNISRRASRSLAVIGMMAGGIFLVVAVNAFRMDATDAGTGGFELIGESSLPVYEDLNSKAGREAFALDEALLAKTHIVPFRVREGDDASCLNLNRAQKPQLVAVHPLHLHHNFKLASGDWDPFELHAHFFDQKVIPAIADQATAMWGLGKGVGDTIDYTAADGSAFQVTLVALLAGSVLQGKVIIPEQHYLAKYPDAAGYRFFLIASDKPQEVSAHLTRQLEQRGLALEPAKQRLEAFLAVQNTYIGIFTILGGLGVLLGTAGLGVLVARHVLERKGELGLMQALGFRSGALRTMILGEHAALLVIGVLLGSLTAALAVFPALKQGGGDLPLTFLGSLIGGILLLGLVICLLATVFAVRGKLIESIRRE
ncbi:MAG: ABC transporter permease [Verrucomicrobiaceae bacterium]|nr:ABC transporter permease [Verrucomicrobiaceae bacterium]